MSNSVFNSKALQDETAAYRLGRSPNMAEWADLPPLRRG